MGNISMNDPFSLNALPWFLKIILSIIGVVFALVLSGDIDQDGLSRSVSISSSIATDGKITTRQTVELERHY